MLSERQKMLAKEEIGLIKIVNGISTEEEAIKNLDSLIEFIKLTENKSEEELEKIYEECIIQIKKRYSTQK